MQVMVPRRSRYAVAEQRQRGYADSENESRPRGSVQVVIQSPFGRASPLGRTTSRISSRANDMRHGMVRSEPEGADASQRCRAPGRRSARRARCRGRRARRPRRPCRETAERGQRRDRDRSAPSSTPAATGHQRTEAEGDGVDRFDVDAHQHGGIAVHAAPRRWRGRLSSVRSSR